MLSIIIIKVHILKILDEYILLPWIKAFKKSSIQLILTPRKIWVAEIFKSKIVTIWNLFFEDCALSQVKVKPFKKCYFYQGWDGQVTLSSLLWLGHHSSLASPAHCSCSKLFIVSGMSRKSVDWDSFVLNFLQTLKLS
jgi:hypothetical protein